MNIMSIDESPRLRWIFLWKPGCVSHFYVSFPEDISLIRILYCWIQFDISG